MIDPHLLLAFIATATLVILIPGPNVALIVANSVAWGPRTGLFTVFGTSSAMALQLGLTTLGMAEALGTAGHWFEMLRWVGVAYLAWLGIAHWRTPPTDLTRVAAQPKSAKAIYGRAVLVSLTNPKTLLFYGAFFPQFVDPARPAGPQVALLSAVFLLLAVTLDSSWALLAGRARPLLARHGRLRQRITGSLLIGAGLGLALARGK
jgi:homoserine/homoserine lactone efflux protein